MSTADPLESSSSESRLSSPILSLARPAGASSRWDWPLLKIAVPTIPFADKASARAGILDFRRQSHHAAHALGRPGNWGEAAAWEIIRPPEPLAVLRTQD
ncbi:uncharacterized protein N7482_000977 [Penicillium canariense]|uniref:Uncharacterized protein n=1 Tax=Penicillium canariense TaxID=189055 RepID=A0A9W9LT52_9EURO|nr:uncharacterized protein N7482_000977 [Penicillium canariense]KAJ5175100.1 hypothetical protein N7482_000977 [Penicillium canariense]